MDAEFGGKPLLRPNEESYIYFKDRSRGRNLCQYEYRDFDGELFSCIKKTLNECVKARDEWLEKKEKRNV